ncbi:PIN domain nuclease [Bosea sp. F3-2]|uniref:type II toxin-antitoxin system VapC family toxin n=1 Tax=Bosea sp. F3-2 TaxID=2599640 RepID=UPI0011F0115F|nr:PIN domain nuclease [Bosea sp. F3-2]QEL25492.1 PIN domain nuclease [Bosea sp. F3-2]
MIVVDSSVWIALLRGEASPQVARLRAVENTSDILVGDLVLTEVLQGARDDKHAATIEALMSTFPIVPLLGPSLAPRAAANYRRLRQRGITIRKTADVIIATYCIEHGHLLLHQDRDFDPMVEHCGLRTL